jgi:hypothetical protein
VSGLAAPVTTAWRRLSREQHQAAIAAFGLVVALFLPWYEKSLFRATGRGQLISGSSNLSAFQVISWVEAAVVLVAFGVLFLLWARSQEKAFHLPGGDGTVILAAGCWAALLLIWRLFDKPNVEGAGATVGIQWGWFVALVMAGLVAAAGYRVRAAHSPEPPLPAEDAGWKPPPGSPPDDDLRRRAQRRRSRASAGGGAAAGEALREPPAWEGEPPDAPGRIPPARPTGQRTDPSEAPTEHGSLDPSEAPTEHGSLDPSEAPTGHGSLDPSEAPTGHGSLDPSEAPTGHGSLDPSRPPTERGTARDPSEAPTERGTGPRRPPGLGDAADGRR